MRLSPLALVLYAVFSPVEVWAAQRTVLITGFDPFAGRSVNSSEQVAKLLGASVNDQVKYKVCILPTVFDEAAVAAEKCFAEMNPKPDPVISTGEADCTVRAETFFHNLDDSKGSDNKGEVRKNHVIEKGAPAEIPSLLPAPAMVCAGGKKGDAYARASITLGNHVCNNTAFILQRYFGPKQIPFGFIHVPVAAYCDVKDKDTAVVVGRMVQEALRSIDAANAVDDCVNCEAGVKKKEASSLARSACITEVKRDISARLSRREKKHP